VVRKIARRREETLLQFVMLRIHAVTIVEFLNPLNREQLHGVFIHWGMFLFVLRYKWRSRWPRGLRRESAAARLLVLRIRIPPRSCLSALWVFCAVRSRSQRQADTSSRGVLPSVCVLLSLIRCNINLYTYNYQ